MVRNVVRVGLESADMLGKATAKRGTRSPPQAEKVPAWQCLRYLFGRMGFDRVVPSEGRRRRISLIGKEALAFARQAALMARNVNGQTPSQVLESDDVVVLLHGLFATAGVLRPLSERIQLEASAHTATFSYAPGPGVHAIARRLSHLLAELPSGARLHLVGHSLGGVVARWFVQELGGDPRIVQTISLGSPFNGTRSARFMPTTAGRDISLDSKVLRRLRERPNHGVPHVSVAASDDTVVSEPAVFCQGERVLVEGCGHNGLLFDQRVAHLVVSRIVASRGWA
ncbi:MAG TPA: hypothetical protein PKA88_08405 [Polyangiaceae bacterium]|nr:hypothetical protein [Polyangiaceae bacterium]